MSYVNFLRKLYFFLHLNPQIKTEIFIIFQILGMRDCHDCMCVTYCSEQHYENDIEKHKENFCQELKYLCVYTDNVVTLELQVTFSINGKKITI